MEPHDLWTFLPVGYLLSIAIEVPILLLGLSRHHPWQRRLFAGVWLTACTYPIVAIVLPLTVWPRFGETAYVAVAEVFAPLAECLLFWWALDRDQSLSRRNLAQDMVAIVVANLASFIIGGWLVGEWWS